MAAAVPPVASTSSMTSTRSSGWMASRWISSLSRAVLQLVLLADDGPRQLAGLAHRHERGAEAVGDRRGEDEAAGLDADDAVDLDVGEAVGELVDRSGGTPSASAEQRRDVAERDAGLRVVGDLPDQRPAARHRRRRRRGGARHLRRRHPRSWTKVTDARGSRPQRRFFFARPRRVA